MNHAVDIGQFICLYLPTFLSQFQGNPLFDDEIIVGSKIHPLTVYIQENAYEFKREHHFCCIFLTFSIAKVNAL